VSTAETTKPVRQWEESTSQGLALFAGKQPSRLVEEGTAEAVGGKSWLAAATTNKNQEGTPNAGRGVAD